MTDQSPEERAAYSAALDQLESEIRVGPDDYPLFHRGWQARGAYDAERVARLTTVVDRLRGAIRDIHDDAAQRVYRHEISGRWILSISDEVWSELRHLSVATDTAIIAEAALATVPVEPSGAGAEEE